MVSDIKYIDWVIYLISVSTASLIGLFCIYAMAIFEMKEAVLGIDLIVDANFKDFVKDYFSYLPIMSLIMLVIAFPGFLVVRRVAWDRSINTMSFYSISASLYAMLFYLLFMLLNIFTLSIVFMISAGITGLIGGITYGLLIHVLAKGE